MVSERRYSISEVSSLVELPAYTLRQWERQVPQLKPKRDRANRRYYTADKVDLVRRVKHLVKNEGMGLEAARRHIARELRGEAPPQTRQAVIDLVDQIEHEVRAMLDLLGSR